METGTRLVKTAKGREEIESRRYKLAGKLRTLLILIDGTRSIEDTTSDARKLGAPDDAVIQLMQNGFVAPIAAGSRSAAAAAARSVDSSRGEAPRPAAGAVDAGGGAGGDAGGDEGAEPESEFAKFRNAKQFMNDTAVDNMGALKKFTFTLKLERCAVRQDLAALMDDYELSLTKSIGRDATSVLVDRLKVLLT